MDDGELTIAEALSARIQALDLRAGDIVVLSHPGTLSEHAYSRLRGCIREALGVRDNKVLVLEEGMELKLVRPDDLRASQEEAVNVRS